MAAPFLVAPSALHRGNWVLMMRHPARTIGWFPTRGEAIDHAYKN
jgi:hypothetical protein